MWLAVSRKRPGCCKIKVPTTCFGTAGLKQLPSVGESIARAIRELVTHGRLPVLDRLRGEDDPAYQLCASIRSSMS
jgi:DNA polymerase/3'-5' exonuclease PolX